MSGKNLLDGSGKFIDDALEDKYQVYVKRNTKSGKAVRERLDWKEASEYMTDKSQVARGNRFNQKAKIEGRYPFDEVHLENGKR